MYTYDLHVHCREGSACCQATLADTIRICKDIGYAGFVLTDHFIHGNARPDRTQPWESFIDEFCRAYYNCLELADKLDFDLLFGLEDSLRKPRWSDMLVYGLDPEFLRAHPEIRDATSAEAWAKIAHPAGGLLIHAHPFRDRRHKFASLDEIPSPDMEHADGFEGYNRCTEMDQNEYGVQRLKAPGRIITAGTDRHGAYYRPMWGVDFPTRVKDNKTLVEYLKTGNFTPHLHDISERVAW